MGCQKNFGKIFQEAKKWQMPIYWLSKMANSKLTLASEMATMVVVYSGAYESPFQCWCCCYCRCCCCSVHHKFSSKMLTIDFHLIPFLYSLLLTLPLNLIKKSFFENSTSPCSSIQFQWGYKWKQYLFGKVRKRNNLKLWDLLYNKYSNGRL